MAGRLSFWVRPIPAAQATAACGWRTDMQAPTYEPTLAERNLMGSARFKVYEFYPNAREGEIAQALGPAHRPHQRPNSVFVGIIGNGWREGAWQAVMEMCEYSLSVRSEEHTSELQSQSNL